MRGLILAGGKGTRLLPATRVVNKHMVPILNKPMIMYPLDTLRAFGITDILIISGGGHIGGIAEFLGDGSDYGVALTYRVQKEAGGIAQALGLAEDFAGQEDIMVILGDNIFDNTTIVSPINKHGAHVFLSKVDDPQRFGVAVFKDDQLIGIEEKPADPPSQYAVTGLYHYPTSVFKIIRTLVPSRRGELEITDVNNQYILQKDIAYTKLDTFWSDAGTLESLIEVTNWACNRLDK